VADNFVAVTTEYLPFFPLVPRLNPFLRFFCQAAVADKFKVSAAAVSLFFADGVQVEDDGDVEVGRGERARFPSQSFHSASFSFTSFHYISSHRMSSGPMDLLSFHLLLP